MLTVLDCLSEAILQTPVMLQYVQLVNTVIDPYLQKHIGFILHEQCQYSFRHHDTEKAELNQCGKDIGSNSLNPSECNNSLFYDQFSK